MGTGKPLPDQVGLRYGMLIILSTFKGKSGHLYANCICDCGTKTIASLNQLRTSEKKSCGCLRYTRKANLIHGRLGDPIYNIWQSMKGRCNNKNNSAYGNYGGRGITVCERWMNSFENFLEDMGEIPDGLELDRIDNNDNYYKENCRWATRIEQARNKRSNVIVEYNGKMITLIELSENVNIKYHTLKSRIVKQKLSVEEAISKPIHREKKK